MNSTPPINNTLEPVDLTDAELDAVSGAGGYHYNYHYKISYKKITTCGNFNGGNILSNNNSGNAIAIAVARLRETLATSYKTAVQANLRAT